MHSLKELKINDARCGDFHPTAPILAIGLYNRPVLLLEGSNHIDSTRKREDQGRRTILQGSEGYLYIIKQQAFGGGACVCHGHFGGRSLCLSRTQAPPPKWNMPKHAHQMSP
jgi:hypothetical protein